MSIGKTKEKNLTLKGHLIELRQRLIKSVIAIVITSGVSFIFATELFDFFQSRAPEDTVFIAIEVTEKIGIYMKLCLYSGVILALPFLIYQLVMFVHPALTREEKKYLYTLLPGVIIFFFAGAAFTYYVFLPPAMEFMIDFPLVDDDIAISQIRIGNYISVVAKMILVMGLVFELPIVIYFFTRIGLVTPQGLSRYRRFAYVGAFIVSAIITPTIDPINQTIVAVPIMILYEVGILLSRLAHRQRLSPGKSEL